MTNWGEIQGVQVLPPVHEDIMKSKSHYEYIIMQ